MEREDRFYDLAAQYAETGSDTETDFLMPEELATFRNIQSQLSYASPRVVPEDGERCCVHFGNGDAQLAVLEIVPNGAVTLRHPDILGALMGLGIERRVVGDIFPTDKKAYVVIKRAMADFFLTHCFAIGRHVVHTAILPSLPEEATPKFAEEEVVLSSLRLDRFVSTVFHIGRAAAQEAIRGGLVFIDGAEEKRVSVTVKPPCRVSFRHHGKVQCGSILRRTRKESFVMGIRRYL